MRDYLELTKPRITALILVSTAIGFLFGMPRTAGLVCWVTGIEPWRFLSTLLGTGLMASGTAALNQWYERDVDSKMHRTARRPIPSGRLKAWRALLFGVLVSAAGFAELAIAVNRLSAELGLFTLLAYLLVYTPLKRRSSICTTVGAIPGAMPPIIGFAGAHGSLTLDAGALAAILFVWQFPHFYAIAWMYRDDYARGGIKMLPVLEPDCGSTVRRMIVFGAALVPVSLVPCVLGMAGPVYAAGAIILGAWYLLSDIRAAVQRTRARARSVVLTSVMYLPAIYALILVDRVS